MKTAARQPQTLGWTTVGLGILFAALRLWRLTASCLWFDEIFSIHAARHDWLELFRFAAADIIHPPLFYVLLKVWIAIGGESLLWVRLLPAIFAIASIVPFILLCRELRMSQAATNFALLLLAVNGYLIKYAQEVRMYSLLLLLSICSLWLFVKILRGNHTAGLVAWLSLINVALVYTHYAGWIVVVVQFIAVLIIRREYAKRFLFAVLVAAVAYLPWLYLVMTSPDAGGGLRQNIGWMTRPHLHELIEFYSLLNKPFWFVQSSATQSRDYLTALVALLLFGIPLVIFSLRVFQKPSSSSEFRALYLFLPAPIAIAFAASWILPQSVWGTRHLIITAAPYSILVSSALVDLRQYWLRTSIYLAAVIWFAVAGVTWALVRPPFYIWCAWTPLAEQIAPKAHQSQAPIEVYAFEDLVAYHIWFADSSESQPPINVSVIKNFAGMQEDPAYFLPRRFAGINTINPEGITADQFWIAYRAASFDKTKPPLDSLIRRGYDVAGVHSLQAQGQQAFLVEMKRIR